MSSGANVIAVDLDREGIWSRLIKETRDSCGSMYLFLDRCTLCRSLSLNSYFPLKKPQSEIKDDAELFKNAGCNLFTQTPEIANWISSVEKVLCSMLLHACLAEVSCRAGQADHDWWLRVS